MPLKTKFTIFRFVKDLEKLHGRNFEQGELAEMLDVDPRTIKALMTGVSTRIDLSVVDKVLNFFAKEGIYIAISDLFLVTQEPDPPA